jgi:hypothetical protein
MRRHYYRQQYQVPKELKPPKKKRSQPLVQPNWDVRAAGAGAAAVAAQEQPAATAQSADSTILPLQDTIHDLNNLKLSPEEQVRNHAVHLPHSSWLL